MKPIRIQRKRIKGWIKPIGAVNCTRPGKYGNPFAVEKYGRQAAVDLYRCLLTKCVSIYDMPFIAQEDAFNSEIIKAYDNSTAESLEDMIKQELGGKDLMCWCALDQPCHADVLLSICNSE